ncbi:glutaminase A [Reyranella sp.]|uniref:glutaminase A n=1 Tax=Reyranella sp. TaxID=1929291 RepID=UPI003D10B42E
MSSVELPLARFLARCHSDFSKDDSGEVASYIPELALANPSDFGIAVTTVDGFVYEIGDSNVEFTIQSISKAFVFALALETVGPDRVETVVGVEPSGDAFNSIRLRSDNRPFNPMVNAGAIACTSLICENEGDGAFARLHDALSRFAGRRLDVDEATFQSERATGDRNRAIAYLLRNHGVLLGDVDEVLDVYFRQCALRVSARDLSVMAATLSHKGRNPLTGEQVVSSYAVARTLSVMTSSGMYDSAGRWVYRVGIPAKSGVGGGIVAALPSQLGLGTYSPRIDDQGNSVRGLRTCEALSTHYGLHMLNRVGDVRTCIAASYDVGSVSSRRNRRPREQAILEAHHAKCAIVELTGALSFANAEYISRRVRGLPPELAYLIVDLRRVPSVSEAALQLMADILDDLARAKVDVVFCGIPKGTPVEAALGEWLAGKAGVRSITLLDEAIEWAEDRIIQSAAGALDVEKPAALAEQQLLAGLDPTALTALSELMTPHDYRIGERMISAGEQATTLLFVVSGVVSVRLPGGLRLATLSAGMAVGEMALLETTRSADVWADTAVACLELSLDAFASFRNLHPRACEHIMGNLARLLAKRLIIANTKIEVLASY